MVERGASEADVIAAIQDGERFIAKFNVLGFAAIFQGAFFGAARIIKTNRLKFIPWTREEPCLS
jgi:hypothetical protein